MRATFAALLLVAGGSAFETANADPYRWCAIFSGDLGGANSCYFNTREQCQATVSGVSGHCMQNPSYSGPAAPALRGTRSRR